MKFLLCILPIGFLLSCQSNVSANKSDFRNLADTSVVFESTEHELHQKLTEALLLSRIDRGVDSFELRIWSKLAMINFDILTILRFKDSNWTASETVYWQKPIENIREAHYTIDSMKTTWFTPHISNKLLIDSLMQFRIDTIPTQQKTPNFEDRTADGTTYTIELSTKHYYKSLTYRNPKYYQEINHQKINSFLNFCSRNLGVWNL